MLEASGRLFLGSINNGLYLTKILPKSPGRILEVGSKDHGSTEPFREFFGGDYVGVDMETGPGVDLVLDLTTGIGELEPASFDLIICCSVLEHVKKPWLMAEHLQSLLKPGGALYLSVPWVWKYHAYPDDYFRYSWRGIETLFDKLKWSYLYYCTSVPGEFFPVGLGKDNSRAIYFDGNEMSVFNTEHKGRKYLPYLEIHGIGRAP